jgi:hypothetical protein
MMHLGLKIGFRGEKMMVLQVRHDRGIRRLQIICSTKQMQQLAADFKNKEGHPYVQTHPILEPLNKSLSHGYGSKLGTNNWMVNTKLD